MIFKFFIILSVTALKCYSTLLEVEEQLVGSQFFLSPCGSQGSNSGHLGLALSYFDSPCNQLILRVFFFLFKTGFLFVALAVLELTL